MEVKQAQQISTYLLAGQSAGFFKFNVKLSAWYICDKRVNNVLCTMWVVLRDDCSDFVLLNGDNHEVYNEPIFKLSRLVELINETELEINNFYVKSASGVKML